MIALKIENRFLLPEESHIKSQPVQVTASLSSLMNGTRRSSSSSRGHVIIDVGKRPPRTMGKKKEAGNCVMIRQKERTRQDDVEEEEVEEKSRRYTQCKHQLANKR